MVSTMSISQWRPRQVRDKPVTSQLICPRRRRLPRVLSRTSPISPLPRRKRACCRLVTGIRQTTLTCRDGLNFETPKLPRDFLVTRSMSATSSWQVVDFPETSLRGSWRRPKAQYTPPTPTRRNCFVASRWRRRCVHEFATSSRRLPTDSAMWTQPMAVTKFTILQSML